MVAQPLQGALKPLAGCGFRQAQLLTSLRLGVAVDHHAQDEVCVHADQAGQFGKQLSGVQFRIPDLEDTTMPISVELVLHGLATGFPIMRT